MVPRSHLSLQALSHRKTEGGYIGHFPKVAFWNIQRHFGLRTLTNVAMTDLHVRMERPRKGPKETAWVMQLKSITPCKPFTFF